MGNDIHAFVEYSHRELRQQFSGRPDEPAHFLARFSLPRDYQLFDALGDGRNFFLNPQEVRYRALHPPRGIPVDLSLVTAMEYYELVVDEAEPHPGFWPRHGCVNSSVAQARAAHGGLRFGTVAQTSFIGVTPPRTWQAIPKERWRIPSWLFLQEIYQALEYHSIKPGDVSWEFQAVLECLDKIEKELGTNQGRLVFWFDS
jgi:hypothetical protein